MWARDIAPSPELRKWFGHDVGRWSAFKKRYGVELQGKSALIGEFIGKAREGEVTLLVAAKGLEHNNAVALREYLIRYMAK